MRSIWHLLLVTVIWVIALPVHAQMTVGMTGTVSQLILPGSELETIPNTDRKSPVVVRIDKVYPHGSAFRYDLEYYGLEPGSFDLKNYLRRKDGSPLGELPSIPVTITPTLAPGKVSPHELTVKPDLSMGGYRRLQQAFFAVWGVGLLLILYIGFFRRKAKATQAKVTKPQTLADRLKPLVEGAMTGTLPKAELAALERTLIAYWRTRLNVTTTDPGLAMIALRQHKEAGPLLDQLETWLHHPTPNESIDIARLLAPYRSLPSDLFELTDRGEP